tara:strand:- start:1262 stop:1648 length:387 start_codon:yes stop_codon:yes gene_type:complete
MNDNWYYSQMTNEELTKVVDDNSHLEAYRKRCKQELNKREHMNILEKANEIINKRSEEKERMYGPFSLGMERAAKIASGCTGKDITASDMYMCMIALKLSRESYNHKEDNLLDAVAYLGALNNYKDEN